MAIIIGIIYDHNENWIAGSYYIENLILALDSIHGEKPRLKIYSTERKQFEQLKYRTQYPYLEWIELVDRNTVLDRVINKVSYTLLGKHWIARGIDSKVDILFPASNTYLFDQIRNKLFWIPDFQERHFPEFFGEVELLARKSFQRKLVKGKWPLVLSSQNAYEDFKGLYPHAKNEVFVLPFAVTLPPFDDIKIESLKQKFNIHRDYFICSNQFWAHKNHRLVLEAILESKKVGTEVLVVFTGKPLDNRNPMHYEKLIDFVNQNNLQTNVLFLGFIDRKEQLMLMKNSLAIIQPSLFEGWSTVVEDAKALNVPVIVSDIRVHREQLGEGHPYYFKARDSESLASLLRSLEWTSDFSYEIDYPKNVKSFGETFLRIIEECK